MMNQRRYWMLCTILGALVTIAPSSRAAAADDASALPSQVLAIFKDNCASCHSPQAKKVKKFNYVLDLPKLVANPKYVIPGDPAKSLLYTQLVDDEMPPDDSDIDPLKPAQKETVKKWIAAGAPTGQPATTQSIAAADPDAGGHNGRAPRPFSTRLVIWLGKFHPLAAHTPIAVLMAAAIAEILYLRRHAPALTHAARFCMVLGAMGAVATAALGWAMATTYSGADRAMLENHRWAGTIAAIASIPIAILGEWGAWRAHHQGHQWHGFSRKLFRVLVFMIAGLVGFTAHLGGLIHWGQNFFAFPK